MSRARDDFYNFYTLKFLEENKKDYPFVFNYISELEAEKAELVEFVKNIQGYNFSDIDWNEAKTIKDEIDSILKKYQEVKDGENV